MDSPPTLADPTLAGFGAVNDPEWAQGVYLLPTHFQTGIIVIHQLPRKPETLWFRLMGRGTVQENAISEVAALPANSQYRGNALDLFLSLKLELESKQKTSCVNQEGEASSKLRIAEMRLNRRPKRLRRLR